MLNFSYRKLLLIYGELYSEGKLFTPILIVFGFIFKCEKKEQEIVWTLMLKDN